MYAAAVEVIQRRWKNLMTCEKCGTVHFIAKSPPFNSAGRAAEFIGSSDVASNQTLPRAANPLLLCTRLERDEII